MTYVIWRTVFGSCAKYTRADHTWLGMPVQSSLLVGDSLPRHCMAEAAILFSVSKFASEFEMISPSSYPSARALLFAGHLIDDPERFDPRFPPDLEPAAARAIARAIAEISPTIGIASAARGGDILFHEACRAQGIETTIILPFAIAEFEKRSVSGLPTGQWERRFHSVLSAARPSRLIVLDASSSSDPYGACNKAMLERAQASDQKPMLLALWDGRYGDGPGGTAEMVKAIERLGGRVVIIEPASLSGH